MKYYKHKRIENYYAYVKGSSITRINTKSGFKGDNVLPPALKEEILGHWKEIDKDDFKKIGVKVDLLERVS